MAGPTYRCDSCGEICGAKPLPKRHDLRLEDGSPVRSNSRTVRQFDLCDRCLGRLQQLLDLFLVDQQR